MELIVEGQEIRKDGRNVYVTKVEGMRIYKLILLEQRYVKEFEVSI